MANVIVDDKPFTGTHVKTPNADLLMIQGPRGFLGCGYFDVETADKIGDAMAVVRGVCTFDDMLKAEVVDVSKAGAELGIALGMTGREALVRMA